MNLRKVSSVLVNEKEPIPEVKIEGLLAELSQGETSNGKKYVTGQLVDKHYALKFKKWDCSLEQFLKENNLDINNTYVVQGTGRYEFYQNEPQFILTSNLALSCAENKIEEYLDCISTTSINNYVDYIEKVGKKIEDPILANVFNESMKDVNKLLTAPYSSEIHTERGGFFQHIMNCLLKAATMQGTPKKKKGDKLVPTYDPDTIYTAIMLYRSAYLDNIEVNNMGNIIKENEINKVLFGRTSNLLKANDLFLAETQKANTVCDKQDNVMHCVAALNGLVAPATIEAITVCNIVKAELEEWESAKKLSTILPGETITYKENNQAKTLVKLP